MTNKRLPNCVSGQPVLLFTLRNSCVSVFRDESLAPVPYRARVDYRFLPMRFPTPEAAREFLQDNLEQIRALDDVQLRYAQLQHAQLPA